MTSFRCDTYCGLYCGACEIVNARTEEQKQKVIHMFESNIPGWQASPDQMRCSGCKTEDLFINCSKCPIRPCARGKGVEFCHECADFPCAYHKYLIAASETVPVLRHIKAIEKNQKYIRNHGLGAWLNEQEEKWKCPICGARFSWYTELCSHCGHDLKGIKDYE